MPKRTAVNTQTFAHVNPVPVASRIGRHLSSGVLTGRDLETRQFPESLDDQVRIVFARIAELMDAAGGSPEDILKITFWVERYRDRDAINREWEAMFPDPDSRPARQIVKAELDEGALLQADVIAILPEGATEAAPQQASHPTTAPGRPFELTAELRAALEATPVSTLSAALRKRGHVDIFVDGVATNRPGVRMVGSARTLRMVPFRPDLFAQRGGGYNAQKRAFDTVNEGEVLVIEARGERGTGTVGDILALRAQVRGAAGIVTDGGIRDAAQLAELGIPIFSKGPHPSVLGRRHVPWETDVVIGCGGAAIVPGDVIVGDDDGVIVIPAALVEEVTAEAVEQEREDARVAEQVAAGHPVEGLFPPNAEWKARFREQDGA